jgi:hypothetical protein
MWKVTYTEKDGTTVSIKEFKSLNEATGFANTLGDHVIEIKQVYK